jgi:hypothetical protein
LLIVLNMDAIMRTISRSALALLLTASFANYCWAQRGIPGLRPVPHGPDGGHLIDPLFVIVMVGLCAVGAISFAVHFWRNRTVAYLRIIKIPPGEAPECIRRAWIGVALQLRRADSEPRPIKTVGVLSSQGAEVTTGWAVDGRKAVQALATRSPEAAKWWLANAPHVITSGYRLFFPTGVCERLASVDFLQNDRRIAKMANEEQATRALDLGDRIDVFKPKRQNIPLGLFLSTLLMVVGAAAIGFPLHAAYRADWNLPLDPVQRVQGGGPKSSWPAVGVLCLLGIGLTVGGIALAVYSWRLIWGRVEIWTNGFRFCSRRSAEDVFWADIVRIQETLHYGTSYTVETKSGKKYRFNGDSVKGIQRFGDVLRQQADRLSLPWELALQVVDEV